MAASRPIACVLLAAAAAPPAYAETAVEKARAEYERGVAAFRQRDFATALDHFERAFKLDPSPILLYNLARTHEEMGHAHEAIENFRLYLDRVPDAPDRADVERRIRVMQAILEHQGKQAARPETAPATAPAPAATTAAAPPRPAAGPDLRPWAYGSFAAGGLALGAALVFGARSAAAEEDHRAATTGDEKARTAADAEDAALLANVGFAAAGAFAVAGATLWLLSDDEESDGPAVAASADGVLVRWRGEF